MGIYRCPARAQGTAKMAAARRAKNKFPPTMDPPAAVQAEFQPAEVTRAGFPRFNSGYTFAERTVVLEDMLRAKAGHLAPVSEFVKTSSQVACR